MKGQCTRFHICIGLHERSHRAANTSGTPQRDLQALILWQLFLKQFSNHWPRGEDEWCCGRHTFTLLANPPHAPCLEVLSEVDANTDTVQAHTVCVCDQ